MIAEAGLNKMGKKIMYQRISIYNPDLSRYRRVKEWAANGKGVNIIHG